MLGGLLSVTSVGLKPLQDKQVELDTKKKILGAVMDISQIVDPNELLTLYEKRVKSIVVDINGDIIEKDAKGNEMIAEKVNIQKNYRFAKEDRQYPVFMFWQMVVGKLNLSSSRCLVMDYGIGSPVSWP